MRISDWSSDVCSSDLGIGLTGDRERSHTGPADASGIEVTVDDAVDLVGAGGRLVDALRIGDDHLPGAAEQVVEGMQVGHRQAGDGSGRGGAGERKSGV